MGERPHVAYFCMEFGLAESLPIYSGGLGVLAGDFMRSAHALDLPVTGVGIVWGEGYTTQRIVDSDGHHHDLPTPLDRRHLIREAPIVNVTVGDHDVPLHIFRVEGLDAAPLYLLEPVEERDRWITRRLYGGGKDDRVAQEIVLGVGGVRALQALGRTVDVYHFNEGHALFAGLELLRQERARGLEPSRPSPSAQGRLEPSRPSSSAQGRLEPSRPSPSAQGRLDFEEAWKTTRHKIVFTTHTPVDVGNEEHEHTRLKRLGLPDSLGFTREELETLGGAPFNMTVAALRLSRAANAVAELHGHTARRMWRHVTDAAPITAITNGVDHRQWQDARIRAAMSNGSDHALDHARGGCRRDLVDAVEARTGTRLDETQLIIGFARRATAYKRATLLFSDEERMLALLDRGVQVVYAGKAHPHDLGGQELVREMVQLSRRFAGRVVFVPDYNLALGRLLTRGVDVWLNTPRRPLEACGTSGMKAAMNGVLNLSIPDGWWPEACNHGVNGWRIGDGHEPALDDNAADLRDADELYALLEEEVVPTFQHDRARWRQMMRASIVSTEARFSSDRMLRDYYAQLYRAPRPAERVEPRLAVGT
jgi:starch phosphorylase